jgi:hypothetical protein
MGFSLGFWSSMGKSFHILGKGLIGLSFVLQFMLEIELWNG